MIIFVFRDHLDFMLTHKHGIVENGLKVPKTLDQLLCLLRK